MNRQLRTCVQFEARTAGDATRELERILTTLRTDYVDILTFYYVEEQAEWERTLAEDKAFQLAQWEKWNKEVGGIFE